MTICSMPSCTTWSTPIFGIWIRPNSTSGTRVDAFGSGAGTGSGGTGNGSGGGVRGVAAAVARAGSTGAPGRRDGTTLLAGRRSATARSTGPGPGPGSVRSPHSRTPGRTRVRTEADCGSESGSLVPHQRGCGTSRISARRVVTCRAEGGASGMGHVPSDLIQLAARYAAISPPLAGFELRGAVATPSARTRIHGSGALRSERSYGPAGDRAQSGTAARRVDRTPRRPRSGGGPPSWPRRCPPPRSRASGCSGIVMLRRRDRRLGPRGGRLERPDPVPGRGGTGDGRGSAPGSTGPGVGRRRARSRRRRPRPARDPEGLRGPTTDPAPRGARAGALRRRRGRGRPAAAPSPTPTGRSARPPKI